MDATARWVGMTQQALDPERRFSQRSRMDDWEHYRAPRGGGGFGVLVITTPVDLAGCAEPP